MIKQAYIHGFLTRCAQHGVDGRKLLKMAEEEVLQPNPTTAALVSSSFMANPGFVEPLLAASMRPAMRESGYMDNQNRYTPAATNFVNSVAPFIADRARNYINDISSTNSYNLDKEDINRILSQDSGYTQAANTNLWPWLDGFNTLADAGDELAEDMRLADVKRRAEGKSVLAPPNPKARTPSFVTR